MGDSSTTNKDALCMEYALVFKKRIPLDAAPQLMNYFGWQLLWYSVVSRGFLGLAVLAYIMLNNTSTSFKKFERSRALTTSVDKLGFTSRASTTQASLMQAMLDRQERGFKIKLRANKLEEELDLKKRQNYELSKNVESALEIAKSERIQWSRGKEQVALMSVMQSKMEKECKQLRSKLRTVEQQLREVYREKEHLSLQNRQLEEKDKQIEQEQAKISELQQLIHTQKEQCEKLQTMVSDNHNLKERIKSLEMLVRETKLQNDECNAQVRRVNQQKKNLEEDLRKTKPFAEQQAERIRYYERVNLDMQRKMDDFTRRQNQLMRQAEKLTKELNQTRNSRNSYRQSLEQTESLLEQKTAECQHFTDSYHSRTKQFEDTTLQFEQASFRADQATKKLEDTIEFYKEQSRQNVRLIERNKALQENQLHIRSTIQHYKMLSQTVNLELAKREASVHALTASNQNYHEKIEELAKQFQRFDDLYNEKSHRGNTEIRETVFTMVRTNKKLELDLEDLRRDFQEKALIFGEERDGLRRDLQLRQLVPPSEQSCYPSIFADKNEQMRILENSNQQLLKIKTSFEQALDEVNRRMAQVQRENDGFKIRVLELFKLNRQHEELKERSERYHNMLLEARTDKQNLQEQMTFLREKNQKLYDELFKQQMDGRTKALTINKLEAIISQLDVETLMAKKQIMEKRELLMNDTVDKFSSVVESLNLYFNCCLCGKLMKDPVTVTLCGHSYCSKCTRGYEDYCEECNTGLPVEKVFANKHLANGLTKFQFLLLLFVEVQKVFARPTKPT